MTTTSQTFRPRRWPTPAPPESTPIFDQLRQEHAAMAAATANTDPEGLRLAAILKAKQETTDVRWFGLPWLRSGRG